MLWLIAINGKTAVQSFRQLSPAPHDRLDILLLANLRDEAM